MTKQIIGVAGFAGSGKDTVADYLVAEFDYRRESFAGTLKDAIAAVFGWDRELLEGKCPEGRAWREKVDQWWATRLGMPHLTPRWVLQNWGTEVCRQAFHNEIWIASLENKLRKTTESIVISDCRFPNELTMIRNLGGKVIRVKRGPEPSWYSGAFSFNTLALGVPTMPDHHRAAMREEFGISAIHPSETAWIGYPFDLQIENDGTLEDLYTKVSEEVIPLVIGDK
jgi:hypothetical protein